MEFCFGVFSFTNYEILHAAIDTLPDRLGDRAFLTTVHKAEQSLIMI